MRAPLREADFSGICLANERIGQDWQPFFLFWSRFPSAADCDLRGAFRRKIYGGEKETGL